MNVFVILSMVILGGIGLFFQFKRAFRLLNVFYLLLFAVTSIWSTTFFSESSIAPIYALIGIVAMNFGMAQFEALRKGALRTIVPFLSMIVFILIFKDDVIEVSGDTYGFVNKFLVAGAVLSIFAYEIARIKSKVLAGLFANLEESEMIKSIFIMFVGLTAFLGFFAASSFGLLVIAGLHLSTSFYRDDQYGAVTISFLGIAVLPLLASSAGISEVNLLSGDVIEGLFFGAFGAYFIAKISSLDKFSVTSMLLSYFIVILLLTGLLLLDAVYSSMGGLDAFIGGIIGVTVVNTISGKGFSLGALLMMLLAIGSYVPQFLVNDELAQFESLTENVNPSENNEELQEELLAFNDLQGSFEMVKDSSIVSFVLGAKGETKGAFKKVSGEIVLNEDLSKSKLKVNLNLDDFTTFNGFRDGSLMEAEYFDQRNYPELNYVSTSIQKVDDVTYKVIGDFEMLGVKKPIEVSLNHIKNNGQDYLIGEGEIDRTLFGMSPSATEGNVVTFNYRVMLKK